MIYCTLVLQVIGSYLVPLRIRQIITNSKITPLASVSSPPGPWRAAKKDGTDVNLTTSFGPLEVASKRPGQQFFRNEGNNQSFYKG